MIDPVVVFLGIVVLAFVMETVDAGLGMMYGTILSPLLLLVGFEPVVVVPGILLSQAIGGAAGSVGHGRCGNADFHGLTRDTKIALVIIVPGLLACFAGAGLGTLLPKVYVKWYIAILVTVMGLLCVFPRRWKFSWKAMIGIGLLGGFNKAISGGGFGPVTSTAKILGGVNPKVSIGTTTLAEVPICFVGFLLWWFMGQREIEWILWGGLCAGAVLGGMLGPVVTRRLRMKRLRVSVGILAVVSGVWLIINLLK